ncbi:uncharacterized protein KGF55_003184 [Candida pseudojiufengensis]|uniref:uncharacterized protein n=1 Tax=Candida pseudojiufengensis TaxID=497109 RepID=UPI00222528B9|nr:uncharacterized protein KGF55_003184 [Candida pseudojiufengensis]KAI5962108.1 hypothetical protein KGF55_003184 [Candida pseudojiufengensis]
MDLFLKLPDELLVLIIKYINDRSKIEELISIPALQNYALQARYFKYQLDNFMLIPSDGSINHLKALYEVYNFQPSKIIIEANKMYELLKSQEEPADSQAEFFFEIENMNQYRHAEFEILITDRMNVQLESILREVNVVGIHLSKSEELEPITSSDIEAFQTYLQAIQFSSIKILSTVYAYNFVDKFPTSLRKLTIDIDCEGKFDMNFSELQCLEYFDCEYMSGVESLEDIQLSRTVKTIKLSCCEFKTLGNLKTYNFLRCIEIHDCEDLFEMIKCSFPKSLETLVLNPSYRQNMIRELHGSVKLELNKDYELSDFSSDGHSLLFGSNFKLPSTTKILEITGYDGTIELGKNLCLKTLHTLNLFGIKNIELNKLFASLPENMIKLDITRCELLEADKCLYHPNIQQIYFVCNKISNIFQINLKQLKHLNLFVVTGNTLVAPGNKSIRFDPIRFLINEFNVFEGTIENSNKKRKVCGVTETLHIDLASITHLDFSRSYTGISKNSAINDSNTTIQLPSQINIQGCIILKVLTLSGLSIRVIDLNKFPSSLRDVTITGLELLQIKGEFSRLNQLIELNLAYNDITHSMLVAQNFPSTLRALKLSGNEIEDLTCLKINNCVNLRFLDLENVTSSQNPNGANELKELFIKLVGTGRSSRALVTTYESTIVFSVINGTEDLRGFL